MSDWTRGYPTSTAYVDAIQPAMSPWRWRQALAFANRDAPDPSKPFRFLELGCGSATTLIALAAAYPHGQFVGYDFMPEPVQMANDLIAETGLTNVEVHEGSFAEMADAVPDETYDFAATHGVWAWVPESVRDELVRVLRTWLSPGAVFYVGYNTAAGWAGSEPIRQIFRTAPTGPEGDRFGPARKAVSAWLEHMGETQPLVKRHWATLVDSSDDFMAHELANPNGTGLWMEEVAERLDEAKMRFGGPAVLAEHMDAPFLSEPQVAYLRRASEEGWLETARDLTHGRFFRKDLYHRGAPYLRGGEMVARMRALRVVPCDLHIRTGAHLGVYRRLRNGLPDDLTARVQALAEGGTTFGAVMDGLEMEEVQAFQIVLMAFISGALLDLRPEAEVAEAQDGCTRFNDAMRRRGEGLPGLVSPTTGICLQFPEAMHREMLAGNVPMEPGLMNRLHVLGIGTS